MPQLTLSDYTVYQPVNQSKRKVFIWTFLGLIIPLLFTEMLGAVSTWHLPAVTHLLTYIARLVLQPSEKWMT